MKLPRIPTSDGAGEVVEVGDGVTTVKQGDRVSSTFFQNWIEGEPTDEKCKTTLGGDLDGMLAEYVLLNQYGLVKTPVNLTDEEAATLPCAAVTAWNSLIRQGKLKAGETVLVQGSGGVSIFALQFAKLCGARVIATSSHDEKISRLLSMGASDCVNYKNDKNWGESVRLLSGGAGVDHVVEVGGAGTLNNSTRAVRRSGHVSVIGVLSGAGDFNPMTILMKGIRMQGVFVGSREMFLEMNRVIELHNLKPVIDRVFPFEESRQALEYMASGAHFGKIVIKL
jgi:NADPH:quinone reductase-like Zn-dependent oxidoreductase